MLPKLATLLTINHSKKGAQTRGPHRKLRREVDELPGKYSASRASRCENHRQPDTSQTCWRFYRRLG